MHINENHKRLVHEARNMLIFIISYRVNHHDIVAAVCVGLKCRLMLAPDNLRKLCGKSTHHLTTCIHKMP